MTHAELVKEIEARCKRRRLRCQRTPVPRDAGPGQAGWVDLVILGRGAALFVEVKSQDGRRTMQQLDCAQQIATAALRYRVWRPSDLDSGAVDQALDHLG